MEYQLDPTKLRELTPEEENRLDNTLIDYSDIPPLDDEFFRKATTLIGPANGYSRD